MPQRLQTLKSDMQADLAIIERLFNRLPPPASPLTDPQETIVAAYYLHNLSQALENLCRLVVTTFDHHLPSGDATRLFERLGQDVEFIRPKLWSEIAIYSLHEIYYFSHYFRRIYRHDLEPAVVQLALQQAHQLQTIYRADCERFINFINRLINESAQPTPPTIPSTEPPSPSTSSGSGTSEEGGFAPFSHRFFPQSDRPANYSESPADGTTSAESTTSRQPAFEAERRHLTVMFCDLVGSTMLSEQLDPEELREVVLTYQRTSVEAITPFAGYVAQYLGDGLLIYFGYPEAHEDDAQRAVRAGLDILAGIRQLNKNLPQRLNLKLSVRIGIHTGLVVVGEIGSGARREQLALGETTNLAARLQGFAAPDTVVISAATYRLIEGFFECQALGSHHLKGLSDPTGVYRILRESGVRNRLEATPASRLTPVVGREQELELLLARWHQTQEGHGQVVLLRGEAGIGKSRLLQLFRDRLADSRHTWLETRCSPYYQHSFLYPITELLQRELKLTQGDSPTEKLANLTGKLARYQLPATELTPLFAALLSLPLSEQYPTLSHMSPQLRKQKTMVAILELLLRIADHRPLVAVLEDLHWIDPSSLDLLNLIIEQIRSSPILLLLTSRPNFKAPWSHTAHLSQLTLNRLSHKQTYEMIKQVTKGKSLPTSLVEQIVAKTDGVPLFAEELTKMVLELGFLQDKGEHYELSQPLPALNIPTTLYDSLAARLDRLEQGREVAQIAAIIGREFTYALLQAITPLDEPTLQHNLSRLVSVDMLYQRGLPPQSTHMFKHALIQEVAYRSLLRSKRQQYHQQIAEVLERRFPEVTETQPEILAHHFEAAKCEEQAVFYWQRAGIRAIERSANLEAIEHLTKALKLLKRLPETAERIHQQLDMYLMLGLPLLMTKGYAALEVARNYAQARQLCQQVGETPQLFSVLFGLWTFYLTRADHQTARLLGKQLMRMAQRFENNHFLLQAYQVQGINDFYQGNFAEAGHYLEEAISLYYSPAGLEDVGGFVNSPLYGGADHGVASLLHLALAQWMLGYPDQAREKMEQALGLAQELEQPFSEALAWCGMTWLWQCFDQPETVQQYAAKAMTISQEQGFAVWGALGLILHGWALMAQGEVAAGVAQTQQGLQHHQATGAELGEPHFMALLAEGYRRQGDFQAGQAALDKALRIVTQVGEHFFEAELYRLQGELWLQQAGESANDKAEWNFQQALALAQRQQAKSLELRATMSLTRWRQTQGQTETARQPLQQIYEWFSEGLETADLQQARQLLAELSQEEDD